MIFPVDVHAIAKSTGLSHDATYRRVRLIWGSWYEALNLLLKPTVEKLIKRGYDRKYIAAALSGADKSSYEYGHYRMTPDTLEKWACERWWTSCTNWNDVQEKFLKDILDSYITRGYSIEAIADEFDSLNYQQIKYRLKKFYKDEFGQGLAAGRRILLKPILEDHFRNQRLDDNIINALSLENWLPFGSSSKPIIDANRLLQRLTEDIFLHDHIRDYSSYISREKYIYGRTPTDIMRNFYVLGVLSILRP